MRVQTKLVALVTLFHVSLIGCGDSKKRVGPEPEKNSVTYNQLKLEVKDQHQLNATQKLILEAVNSGRPVNFTSVTQALIAKHVSAFNKKNPDLKVRRKNIEKRLKELYRSIGSTKTWNHFKMAMEFQLESKKRNGKSRRERTPLVYNRDEVSLVSPLIKKKLQCFSGTSLFHALTRSMPGQRFEKQNFVMIFESGHILPGYLKKTKKGWKLMGVETTVAGLGRKSYGLTSKITQPIRVVDAGLWAIIEIFSQDLKNQQTVVKAALEWTAKKYGILLKKNEPLVVNEDRLMVRSGGTPPANLLNQSIFAFGEANVPSGDMRRLRRNKIHNARMSGVNIANGNYIKFEPRPNGRDFESEPQVMQKEWIQEFPQAIEKWKSEHKQDFKVSPGPVSPEKPLAINGRYIMFVDFSKRIFETLEQIDRIKKYSDQKMGANDLSDLASLFLNFENGRPILGPLIDEFSSQTLQRCENTNDVKEQLGKTAYMKCKKLRRSPLSRRDTPSPSSVATWTLDVSEEEGRRIYWVSPYNVADQTHHLQVVIVAPIKNHPELLNMQQIFQLVFSRTIEKTSDFQAHQLFTPEPE